VAQIPALIISVAAGLVVSRVGDEGDIGGLVIGQVFSNPQVLVLTAAIIGVLGLIPGMPNLVFLLLAPRSAGLWPGCGASASSRRRRPPRPEAAAPAPCRRRQAWRRAGTT
jgi:flagellar biosynthesis protein FlhA